MTRLAVPLLAMLLAMFPLGRAGTMAQQIDLAHGGPIDITASEGLEWHQNEQRIVARGNARAVRGGVTVTAEQLIAHYRKKGAQPGATPTAKTPAATPAATPTGTTQAGTTPKGTPPSATRATKTEQRPGLPGGDDNGADEIYRVEAIGNVHIFTATDQAWGARAIYDMDQSVMLMTGRNLNLTTPTQVLTARDSMEYWTQKRMAVARGDAVVVTNEAKRLAADTVVAYTKEDAATGRRAAAPAENPAGGKAAADNPLGGSGKLQRAEGFGHVSIRTPTETVTGDRGIYVADTGMARIGGNVRITRGQNQLNGSDAEVNMNTGVSRLLAGESGRVTGLVVPNDPATQGLGQAADGHPASEQQPGGQQPATPGRRKRTQSQGTQPQGTQPQGKQP